MKLKQLLKGIEAGEVKGSKEIEITGIASDSRTVAPGNLFLAKKGDTHDGTQFIPQALSAGAAAIATDLYDPFLKVPQLIHPDIRAIEAKLAARYYGDPSKQLFTAGTTGTKGKTTTNYLIKHLLDGLGRPAGLMGTVETIIGETRIASSFTTSEPIAMQKSLKEMLLKGCKAAALEVSSHGLELERVGEIEFSAAIFTNLYPDHLDFHQTMEQYANAKAKLFQRVKKIAILNADSSWSPFMASRCSAPVLTYGIEAKADVAARNVSFSGAGTTFEVCYQGKKAPFRSPLIGKFNVYNLLGAISLGVYLGAELETIAEILARFSSVPGRLEPVPALKGPRVFVDFAHTGEALENVLQTLKEIAPKKVHVVFGCGGNRDPGRRKGMAEAAERIADRIVVTSDNPRQEDPEAISQQILDALSNPGKAEVELDRKKAIFRAIQSAGAEDLVLIAGKGHEKVQIFAHQTIPFDDVAIAKEALQNVGDSAILATS